MDKLNVLIVDDSVVYRRILVTAVERTAMAASIQAASNGVLALERMQQASYDVVLLDVNMPEMDGIEALRRMKATYPKIQVIMISSTGGKNAAITLETLQLGAMDFIVKPLDNDFESNMVFVQQQLQILFGQVIIDKLNPLKQTSDRLVSKESESNPPMKEQITKTHITGIDLVVVAASTGGPVALEKLLTGLSHEFLTPILVVQHMPPDFTKVFAENLDKKCSMKVFEGKEDDILRAGQIIIAPGGYHMYMKKLEGSIKKIGLNSGDFVNGVRPAADILFQSVAKEYAGARILAIVLTGMGTDGRDGVVALKKACRCYCIAQSEASCVVFGMPGSVVGAKLSDEVLDIDRIAHRMLEIRNNGS